MDYKVELVNLVKTVKANVKIAGEKLRNEDIAVKLKMSKAHFQDLLSPGGASVTDKHILVFKTVFKNELAGAMKPSKPKDPLNVERAYIKTLVQRFAALESRLTGQEKTIILAEIERDTISNLRELEEG